VTDQAVDEVALAPWLEANVDGFRGPFTLEKFSWGQSNPTYRIAAASGDYVLRRKPFGQLLPSAHAVDREYRLIAALHPLGFPVARPYALCADTDVIGAIFYVMELVSGRAYTNGALPEFDAVMGDFKASLDKLAIPNREQKELLAIIELRSRDRARIVRVLHADDEISGSLVPHVIPLLAWDALTDDAAHALRRVAEDRVGEFTDTLLDQHQPFAIRRRLARVFSVCRSQRAVDGLMLGLDDMRFEVRYQCARSLATITDANADLRIETNHTFNIVQREATVSRHVWDGRQLLDRVERDEREPFGDELITTNQSLAHVFTLLSLILPRQPLRIAFRGLHTNDDRLRGTALEYLELILPAHIHERLSPLLDAGRTNGPVRSRETVLAELLVSNDSIVSNLAELKRGASTSAQAATP